MKKNEMSIFEQMLEAIGIVTAALYLGLQIYYGAIYAVSPLSLIINIAAMLLVYVGLTLLQRYPERVNNLPAQVCSGRIRIYTVRMVRLIKLIIVISLFFTSVCDVLGIEMDPGYRLIVALLILPVTVYYEYRIFHILRNSRKK